MGIKNQAKHCDSTVSPNRFLFLHIHKNSQLCVSISSCATIDQLIDQSVIQTRFSSSTRARLHFPRGDTIHADSQRCTPSNAYTAGNVHFSARERPCVGTTAAPILEMIAGLRRRLGRLLLRCVVQWRSSGRGRHRTSTTIHGDPCCAR